MRIIIMICNDDQSDYHDADPDMAQLWKERGNNMQVATSLCFQLSKHSTQNAFAFHIPPFGRTLDMNFSFSVVLLNRKEKQLSPQA